MILCVCKNISAQAVQRAQHQGHDSFEAIQIELGAATCCGKCEPAIRDALCAKGAAVAIIPHLVQVQAQPMFPLTAHRDASPFARAIRFYKFPVLANPQGAI